MAREYDSARHLVVRDLFSGTKHAPSAPTNHDRIKFQPPPKAYKPPLHYSKMKCPFCGGKMSEPDLEMIVDWYDLPPQEEAILRVLWSGKGLPVSNDRIINAIYADDPDGGPSPSAAYGALKVGMSHLRARLRLSGVKIENAGYRQGYRVTFRGKQ